MSQAVEGWYDATVLLPSLIEDEKSRSLSDIAVRDEAKEVRPDARPPVCVPRTGRQAWKDRKRIRWNTLRIFSG